jgi:hypothetical protein
VAEAAGLIISQAQSDQEVLADQVAEERVLQVRHRRLVTALVTQVAGVVVELIETLP